MSGIKRTPADIAFSQCIRARANYTCERCKKYFPEGQRGGLDCSHHHGRGRWGIRFEPLNAEALCYGCHSHVGGTEERRREVLTDEQQDLLYEMMNDQYRAREARRTKGKGKIAQWYRAQLKAIEDKRAKGETGRIDFQGWL